MSTNDEVTFSNRYDVEEDYDAPESRRMAKSESNLDRLRSLMATEVAVEPLEIAVPMRKGLSLDIDVTGLTVARLNAYQKKCKVNNPRNRRERRSGGGESEIDPLRYASLVLYNHCIGLKIHGQPVLKENGQTVQLNDDEFLEMVNVLSPDDVSALMTEVFVMETHVIDAFSQIEEYMVETTEVDDDENPLEG